MKRLSAFFLKDKVRVSKVAFEIDSVKFETRTVHLSSILVAAFSALNYTQEEEHPVLRIQQ